MAVQALTSRLPGGRHVEAQQAVTLLSSEVEPDAMVVRGGRRDDVDRHPGGGDLGLVVEVSDSSPAYDRGFKKELFARAGIPVYWIVNLVGRCVEVYADPAGNDYRNPEVFGEMDEVPFDSAVR